VNKPRMAAGFDPSFTHGGDRAALVIVRTGMAVSNSVTVPVTEVVEVVYLDDNLDTTKDKKELILERLKREMQKHGVSASHLAMDASGDSFMLALHICRMRLEFTCAEKVTNPAKEPGPAAHPMAHLISWGQKKPKQLVEPAYADLSMGAGWDSEKGGFGHMFGGGSHGI